MKRSIKKWLITMLIVLLGSLIFSATASGEWKPQAKGTVLEEDSIVGTIEDGRKMVEKVKGLEARIDAQDEALERIEGQVKIISASLAQAQEEIKEIPDLLKKAEEEFGKTLKKEKAKSTVTGIVVGVILGGIAASIF